MISNGRFLTINENIVFGTDIVSVVRFYCDLVANIVIVVWPEGNSRNTTCYAPPPLPGYPMIGLTPLGMPPYSIPPNPYQSFQSSDINFYNQPPFPTAPPISRQ